MPSAADPAVPPLMSRLAGRLDALVEADGFTASPVPGVRFMRASGHVRPFPVVYDPSIVIIARGKKVGRVDSGRFVYDASRYLLLTLPVPFECETFGDARAPLVGLSLSVGPMLVAGMASGLPVPEAAPDCPVGTAAMTGRLADAALRLAECMGDAHDARFLGPKIAEEIVWHVLRGPMGGALRRLAEPDGTVARLRRALDAIHRDCAGGHDIGTLASVAGMSVSAFHERFRRATGSPPLRYLKTVRLQRARLLMLHEGETAASAAARVGYASPSQFSREFRRLFGAPPGVAVAAMRPEVSSDPSGLASLAASTARREAFAAKRR